MTVRVGVIGTGIMGADHISTLHRQVTGAAVTMVADLDLARARAVATAVPDVRATDDGVALIGDPAVDAVVVASADATHADLTVAAVRAGKPVMCEKPLAPTVPECLRVVRAEQEAVEAGGPALVSVGFTGYPADWRPRFADAYRLELQAWVDAVAAGHPSPLASARDGLIASAVADAVIASMGQDGRRALSSFPSTLPAARTPPSAAAPALRWGVLGTGWIAERFARSLQRHTRQQLLAVGSRDADRSAAFAGRHGLPRAYGSYEELVADPDVDVVYVATPHPAHHPCATLALEAGKHALVEKPLALNAAQASEIAHLAADRGRFCAEALWTFFLPRFDVVRQLLDDGALGEVRTVQADHGEYFTAGHRILRADLAGGPLLDLGTYPLALATWVLGPPARILAAGQPHVAGVNGQAAVILCDPHGNQAVLHTTLFSNTPTAATIAGTHGTLALPGPFYQPGDLLLTSADGNQQLTFTEPKAAHDALHFEAAEVARCVTAGRLESPIRPLADSITTIQAMDEIRRQLGITFPGER